MLYAGVQSRRFFISQFRVEILQANGIGFSKPSLPIFERAFELRGFAKDLRQEREHLGLQIQSKARASQSKNIRAVESMALENKPYTQRIASAGKARNWDEAWAAFSEAPEQRSTILFNATIHAAFLCGRYKKGLSLFEEMRAKRLTLTAPTFTTVLHIFARLGRQSEVDQLWQEMLSKKLQEGNLSQAYLAMISAKARAGDVAGAQHYLGELASLDSSKVDSGHFQALLHACAKARDAGAALRCMAAMRRRPKMHCTVLAFRSCMRALRDAPLVDIQCAYAWMESDGVDMDESLLEAYLEAVAGKDLNQINSVTYLHKLQSARVDVLLSILRDAENLRSRWTAKTLRLFNQLQDMK